MSGPAHGIDERLERSRRNLRRLYPAEVPARLDAGAVLVDIRPVAQRVAHGEVPGAVVIDRNVLEWRLDPTSVSALPWASHDLEVIVMCQQGYSSSLAAETLQELGIAAATDMVGGFESWLASGLPVVASSDT